MYNHAPDNYVCPFCLLAQGQESEGLLSRQADVFYRDAWLTAFIPAHTWPNNHGNAIIIPNAHYENLFDLPDDMGARIYTLSRQVARAMKQAYGCAGISTRQHNEPAGNQDVWHYHLHIFPRSPGDNLYGTQREPAIPEERAHFARLLNSSMRAEQITSKKA